MLSEAHNKMNYSRTIRLRKLVMVKLRKIQEFGTYNYN